MKSYRLMALAIAGFSSFVYGAPPGGELDVREVPASAIPAEMMDHMATMASRIMDHDRVQQLTVAGIGDRVFFFVNRMVPGETRLSVAVRGDDGMFRGFALDLRITRQGSEVVALDADALALLVPAADGPDAVEKSRSRESDRSVLEVEALGELTGMSPKEFDALRERDPGFHALYANLLRNYDYIPDADTGEVVPSFDAGKLVDMAASPDDDSVMLSVSKFIPGRVGIGVLVRTLQADGPEVYGSALGLDITEDASEVLWMDEEMLGRLVVDEADADDAGGATNEGVNGLQAAASADTGCQAVGNNAFCCGYHRGNQYCVFCLCRTAPGNNFQPCGEACDHAPPSPTP